MAESIAGTQKGGIGGAIKTVTSAVVIAYLVAIGLSLILFVVASLVDALGIFPEGKDPVIAVYNMVRGLTIFILLFLPSLAILTASWVIDVLIGELLFPIINTILDNISFDGAKTFPLAGVNLPEQFNLTQTATDFLANLTTLVNNVFPKM